MRRTIRASLVSTRYRFSSAGSMKTRCSNANLHLPDPGAKIGLPIDEVDDPRCRKAKRNCYLGVEVDRLKILSQRTLILATNFPNIVTHHLILSKLFCFKKVVSLLRLGMSTFASFFAGSQKSKTLVRRICVTTRPSKGIDIVAIRPLKADRLLAKE